jgi:hypothetical protein
MLPSSHLLRRHVLVLALVSLLWFAGTPLAFGQAAPDAMAGTATPTVFENPDLVSRFGDVITERDLAAHLYLLASDLFEGREATTRGQRLASKYLASQHRRIGTTPYGTFETDDENDLRRYFQPFQLYSSQLTSATLEATRDGEVVARSAFGPRLTDGHSYLQFGTLPALEAGVVFAGYGIADEESDYNDFVALAEADVSAAGNWVMIFTGEPTTTDGVSLITGTEEASAWSTSFWTKFRAMSMSGARGFLIVGEVGADDEVVRTDAQAHADALAGRVGSLSLNETGARRIMPPAYVISSEFANMLLAGTGQSVESLHQAIQRDRKPHVLDLGDVTLASRLEHQQVALDTENVVAVVEGTDPALRHEYVVLTAHFDHEGIDPTLDGDQVYNGADDDGSGTVALLQIAEALQRARDEGYGPRRSVMFLHVTAEEKGLLGSQYYSDVEPIVPLENTVANLNIDMIGRHDPTFPGDHTDYVYIIGGDLISVDLHEINERVNDVLGTRLELSDRFNAPDDPNQFYRRSDHWHFAKHNIPFIFFFTGTHEDYHQVGDTPDKIDYPRLARISRLIYGTTWQLANQPERPAVSGPGFN